MGTVTALSALFSLLSLCSLPSSFAAAHFSDPTSHLSLRTSHQAIHSASNPLDPVPPFSGPSHHPGIEPLRPSTLSSRSCLSPSSRFSLRSSLFSLRGRPFSVSSCHSRTEP